MKKLLMLMTAIFFLTCLTQAVAAPLGCKPEETPKIIKPMENWDIIATNTGNIPMAPVFNGPNLAYSVKAHPKNRKNIVKINKTTGVVQIQAEKQDNFDVTVTAKNACGKVSNKFNVQIDEED